MSEDQEPYILGADVTQQAQPVGATLWGIITEMEALRRSIDANWDPSYSDALNDVLSPLRVLAERGEKRIAEVTAYVVYLDKARDPEGRQKEIAVAGVRELRVLLGTAPATDGDTP